MELPYAGAVSSASETPPATASNDSKETPQRGSGHEAITRAAREIFADRGYYGTSIRDIAKEAGLSLSALYYWYPSKQDLLAKLIEDSDRDYHDRCAQALSKAADNPTAKLGALVRVTVEYRVERRIDSHITNREYRNLEPENREHLAQNARAATKLWADVINDGVARGKFQCKYPDDARRTIIAACNAIAQWYDPAGPLTADDLVERYTEIALRVVEARRTRRA